MDTSRLHWSLLDYLVYQAERPCLSDLRNLTGFHRTRLLRAVEALRPEDASVQEWNETLTYLNPQAKLAPSAAQAREALLAWLGTPVK